MDEDSDSDILTTIQECAIRTTKETGAYDTLKRLPTSLTNEEGIVGT